MRTGLFKQIIAVFLWAGWLGTLQAQDEPKLVIDTYGHSSMIRGVAFFSEGKKILSVSDDKTIRVWDKMTGENEKTIRGQTGEGSEGKLFAVALSKDERWLAVGGWLAYNRDREYGRIRLIDLETNQLKRNFTGQTGVINTLAFSPDGRYLASGSADKTVRIWDITSGKLMSVLKGHTKTVQDIAFLNNERIISIGYDQQMIIWDWKKKSIVKQVKAHSDKIKTLACTSDGTYIATGGYDHKIILWDTLGSKVKEITVAGSVYALDFSEDNTKLLAMGGQELKGKIYEVSSGNVLTSFEKHDNTVVACDFYKNDRVVSAGGDNNDIYVWDANTGEVLQHLKGKGTIKRTVGFNRDDNIAFGDAWGGRNGTGPLEKIIDFKGLKLLADKPKAENFFKAQTSYNGLKLKYEGRLALRIEGTETVIQPNTTSDGWIRSFTFTKKGKVVVGNNYTLKLFNQKGEAVKQFLGHTDAVWAVAVSMEGKIMASAGGDQTIKLWSLTSKGNSKVKSVAETYTDASWNPIWLENGWLKLAETNTKEAWLQLIDNLKKIKRNTDAETLAGYYAKNIKNATEDIPPLVTLFVGSDNEWVCWTPAGYYAASAGGERYIGWHINKGVGNLGEYYPVSTFRKKYYQPELVKLVISMGDFNKALKKFNQTNPVIAEENIMNNLPPKIEWLNPMRPERTISGNKYRVKARITSDVEIKQVKLLVNGRSVAGQRGEEAVDNRSSTEKYLNYELDLEHPENTIMIYAANVNSATLSEERVIHVNKKAEEHVSTDLAFEETNIFFKPNLYIVTIGVSDFRDSKYNLKYADDDANTMAEIFKSQEGKLYKEVKVKKLTNAQATRANILEAFYWLEENATHKDMVMIFIASHGFNERKNFYILPHDGNHERLRSTGVDWADFQDVLGNLPSKVMLFLDACHSGQLGANMAARGLEVNNTEAIREITSPEYGVVVLSASTGNEKSLESAEWKHGAFTLALVRALKEHQADYDNDGLVYLRELDFYVAEEVKNITRGKQHPTTQKPSTISRLPILQVR